jgi:hypothetical protein
MYWALAVWAVGVYAAVFLRSGPTRLAILTTAIYSLSVNVACTVCHSIIGKSGGFLFFLATAGAMLHMGRPTSPSNEIVRAVCHIAIMLVAALAYGSLIRLLDHCQLKEDT